MNKYVKEFLHRGLIFSGFGPIIVGIVYVAISNYVDNFSLKAYEVCLAIVSMYIVTFLQAGASVFNQIEHWSLPKSLGFHFTTLYVSYVGAYLVNSWIPFEPLVIAIFTAVFVLVYFIIWFVVYIAIKNTSKKLNKTLS